MSVLFCLFGLCFCFVGYQRRFRSPYRRFVTRLLIRHLAIWKKTKLARLWAYFLAKMASDHFSCSEGNSKNNKRRAFLGNNFWQNFPVILSKMGNNTIFAISWKTKSQRFSKETNSLLNQKIIYNTMTIRQWIICINTLKIIEYLHHVKMLPKNKVT